MGFILFASLRFIFFFQRIFLIFKSHQVILYFTSYLMTVLLIVLMLVFLNLFVFSIIYQINSTFSLSVLRISMNLLFIHLDFCQGFQSKVDNYFLLSFVNISNLHHCVPIATIIYYPLILVLNNKFVLFTN